MDATIIICTHNPREDYLKRVLDALDSQTLEKHQWELLLIDNGSKERVSEKWDLSWHPNAHHIREEELGLTPARLRGIKNATTDLIIFVDDDNVLESNYLEEAVKISKSWPMLGAWGASIRGEFEIPPLEVVRPYLSGLAIKELSKDHWGNEPRWSDACPFGAGMCLRKFVAEKYTILIESDPIRKSLDRSGESLGAAGDTDMAYLACDMGYGMGRFQKLKITHLISSRRLTEDYFISLYQGFEFSSYILDYCRTKKIPISTYHDKKIGLKSMIKWIQEKRYRKTLTYFEKRIFDAKLKGRKKAMDVLFSL